MKIKNEELFVSFANDKACVKSSESGRQQFFDFQSRGIKPTTPDPYFTKLTAGKFSFDFLCSEYYKLYTHHLYSNNPSEWWGFEMLWLDWEGQRWVLPYLCSWYEKLTGRVLPKWLGLETRKDG